MSMDRFLCWIGWHGPYSYAYGDATRKEASGFVNCAMFLRYKVCLRCMRQWSGKPLPPGWAWAGHIRAVQTKGA